MPDAARNFDAVLAAAQEVFTEFGADAPLDEVARRAGVGAFDGLAKTD